MQGQDYFNLVAAITALGVIGFGMGVVRYAPLSAAPPAGTSSVSDLNLSISANATTEWPQYSPANFSVPEGTVIVSIVDDDTPVNWTGCSCDVSGTVGTTQNR